MNGPETNILVIYFGLLLAVVLCVAFCIWAIPHFTKIFLSSGTGNNEDVTISSLNKERIIDLIPIILVVILLFVILFYSRNIFADLPYAINKDFSTVTGVVIGHSSAGNEDTWDTRSVTIKDIETQEEIKLLLFFYPVKQGETYTVSYLPNTKAGTIIKVHKTE